MITTRERATIFLLKHRANTMHIVRWRDTKSEFEGADECCRILEATLAGHIVHQVVGVLHEYFRGIFCS